jgi:peptide/nickel transport system ATP-binding protein
VQTVVGLTRGARIAGEAWFAGRDLLSSSPESLPHIRSHQVGMIFQDSLTSLHPHYRVGWQIVEVIREHDRNVPQATARWRTAELLTLVGPDARRRMDDYPHDSPAVCGSAP